MVTHSVDDEADDVFLRQLILCEEDRRRLFPASVWTGGFRWFRSANVVAIEHYRRPLPLPQQKAS
jgi:hypothetical protein